MFTWICPACGREVPPSYDACPDCAAKAKSGEPPAVAVPATPPAQTGYAPQAAQYAPPPPRRGVPTWLLSILFFFAFIGVGGGAYWLVNYFRGGTQAASAPLPAAAPVKGPATAHAMQKYVEISGIRFVETPKHQTEARFVIVNHSGADITDLAGIVNIWGRTVKSEEEAAGRFQFKMPSLGPFESKEATAPVTTKLRVYELPDWQNLSTEVQITSP